MRAWSIALLAACGGGGSTSIDAPVIFDTPPDSCGATPPHAVFLNRGGGSYTMGADDPSMNRSSILDMNRTLVAPTTTDPDWATVLQCVKDKVAAFNITVTDV